MAILITGTSGFVGQELVAALTASGVGSGREIVCLSRTAPGGDMAAIRGGPVLLRGSFDRFEDLRGLDSTAIDTVVHLAAALGGSAEEDALSTNVMGTRRLYRYLLDRGCRKFVTASSIAVAGGLSADFRPLAVPLPDEHPCLAREAYGLSKAMVEQLTLYFHRRHPDADFVNLRLGSVVAQDWSLDGSEPVQGMRVPFVQLARVFVTDVVRALLCVIDAPHRPGVRTCNVVGADISAPGTTVATLREVLGGEANSSDWAALLRPGHERDPIYSIDRVEQEFGFRPERRFLDHG